MNTTIANYFENGCGRCELYATPQCKIHQWAEDMQFVRTLLLDSELKEEVKWGVPCYTLKGKNVITLSAFVNHFALSFFKGVLLKDPKNLLASPGPNSRHAKLFKFDRENSPQNQVQEITQFIQQAIELEKSGAKVEPKKPDEEVIEELETIFTKDPQFKAAFYALTPGRQRGYHIYFSAPKQSQTKISRIEKCKEKIFKGEGLHDKYSGKKT